MIEMPAGLPHAGRLLCGNNGGRDNIGYVTYSDDRGDSWNEASGPLGTQDPEARYLDIVRFGPHAGRVIAAGAWGISFSDDGGATWQPTAIWQYFRYDTYGLTTLTGEAPGGGDRLIVLVHDPQTGVQNGVFVSDDGGDMWTQIYAFSDNPESVTFVDLGSGAALAVLGRGRVWRSEDAGASWVQVGIVPFAQSSGDANGTAKWAWQGPDGRLYVGGSSLGEPGSFGYTWRTVNPLAVASEASPALGAVGVSVAPNPSRGGVVTARVAQASQSADLRVEVWDAVGRRMAVLHEGASVGALSLDVDTSGFAVGVYRVVVTSGGERVSAAFTVSR